MQRIERVIILNECLYIIHYSFFFVLLYRINDAKLFNLILKSIVVIGFIVANVLEDIGAFCAQYDNVPIKHLLGLKLKHLLGVFVEKDQVAIEICHDNRLNNILKDVFYKLLGRFLHA